MSIGKLRSTNNMKNGGLKTNEEDVSESTCATEPCEEFSGRPIHENLHEDVPVPSNSEPSPRGVRFSATIVQYDVLHLNEYSPEEIQGCWYQSRDLEAIRRQAQRLLDAVSEYGEEAIDKSRHSTRGLEKFTEEGSKSFVSLLETGWDAVMDTQDMLVAKKGAVDDVALARQYRKIALPHRFPARNLALKDRKEIANDLFSI